MFYNICTEHLGLKEPELFLLHKVAYICGRVEEIEFLLDLYDYYSAPLELTAIPSSTNKEYLP